MGRTLSLIVHFQPNHPGPCIFGPTQNPAANMTYMIHPISGYQFFNQNTLCDIYFLFQPNVWKNG